MITENNGIVVGGLSANKKKQFRFVPIVLLIIILLSSATFMLNASSQESAIMDELAHIPAGYSYVRYLDYRLNPEHPPLIKSLAALPLLFMSLDFPTSNKSWTTDINGQWDAGNEFIYKENGHKAEKIVTVARIFPIIITLLLSLLVFLWSKKLMGEKWALLPTLFTALSPNILAHGHYVTTDIGAAFGFIIGLYIFVRFLSHPSKLSLIYAGIFFGIAQLTKFSLVLLVPISIILFLFKWWAQMYESKNNIFSKKSMLSLWKYIRSFLLIIIIGYALVGVIYAIFTINYPIDRQVSDTTYILSGFSGGGELGMSACLPQNLSMRCLAEINIKLASIPVLRGLGQYMLGVLMVMQRSSGGNTAYFLGKIGGGGWWYYFPVVFFLKETIASLILIFGGLFLATKRMLKNIRTTQKIQRIRESLSKYILLNLSEFSMILFIVFYWAYSINSPLNIGFRHILPTIPLMYILAFGSIKKWFDISNLSDLRLISRINSAFKYAFAILIKSSILIILVIWFVIEVISASPYYLSYFNEFGGGTWNGYKYVTDSNYDWGQDLRRLKHFVNDNNIDKIAVDYFGGSDIKYQLGDKAVLWNGDKGNPANEGINWIAISVNTIESAKANPYKGFIKQNPNTYSYILDYNTPYARAGTSIFIYKLK